MLLPRIPHRLEHVRDRAGIKTLKEFHRQLGGDSIASYSAVRNYHHCDRNPERERVAPPDYLAQVARVFGARLEWLIDGEGPVTKDEEELRRHGGDEQEPDLYEQIQEEIPQLEELDYSVAVAFMTHLHRWVRARLRIGLNVEEGEALEYAVYVWNDLLREPLTGWYRRIGRQAPLDPNGVSDYMMAMLHALNFSLQVVAPAGITDEEVRSWPPLEAEEEEADG